jgi:hypothetical protein
MQIPFIAVLLSLSLADTDRDFSRSDSEEPRRLASKRPSSDWKDPNGTDVMRFRGPLSPGMEVRLRVGGLKLKSLRPAPTPPASGPDATGTATSQAQEAEAPKVSVASPQAQGSSAPTSAIIDQGSVQNQQQMVQAVSLKLFRAALDHVQQLIGSSI